MITVGGIKRLTPNNPARLPTQATPYIKKLRVVTTITYSLEN